MDWGRGASGQWALSPQPYLIPRSHLLSGMQVRRFKQNPRTCTNWTLEPCQERGLQVSQGRFPRNQRASRPIISCSQWSCDSGSQLPCAPGIWPGHYPLGVGGCKWAVSAHPDIGSKRFQIDPLAGPYEGRGEASNPVPFENESLEALRNLVPPDSQVFRNCPKGSLSSTVPS